MHGCCQSLLVETTNLYMRRRPPYLYVDLFTAFRYCRRCAVRTARITRDHMHGCCQSLMVETTDLYTWRRPPYLYLDLPTVFRYCAWPLCSPHCQDDEEPHDRKLSILDGGDVLPTYILISSRCLDTGRGRCAVRTARMTRDHMRGSAHSSRYTHLSKYNWLAYA